MVCSSCKDAVEKKRHPVRGISNFLIGGIPDHLRDVTEIEWSLVSQNRSHAHLIMYQGGATKKLRGFHSLLKTDIQKISNCMSLIECLNNSDHIKVVLCGHFTTKQRENVRKRCQIK